MAPSYREVLEFWFGRPAGSPQKRWFEKNPAFDAEVRARFLALLERLAAHAEWLDAAEPCLARIVVLDQFPRNMFRGTPRAFATDPIALELAKHAVASGFDKRLSKDERMFLYLPFEHCEGAAEQERCVALFALLDDPELTRYAVAHKEIIDRFGRFPHRNAILGRVSTPEELEFLKQPASSF